MKKTLLAATISSLALSSAMTVQAQSLDDLVKESSVDLNFRYRVESADVDDGTNDSALANTLKSRITFKSAEVGGVSLLVEGDSVLHVTDDFYDGDGANTDQNDKVLDQETTQINQAYVQYQGFDTTVKVGNQRINLDNQRHVGSVGFRQDEATFDAVTLVNQSVENLTVVAGFANNVNTITNANLELDISILNAKYAFSPELAATTFFYGAEDTDGETLDTVGFRAVGDVAGIKYEAEVASQDNSATDTTALYYNFSAAKKVASVTTKLGYEVFGSDDGEASFATPLGTNHKFLGWSDTYLNAPGTDGIQDINLSAVAKVSGVKLVAQYHKFDTVEGSDDLGSEIGLMAAKKFGDYGASIKLAQFSEGDAGVSKVDATKLWVTGTAKF
jgi:hypothetical protein